MKAMMELKRAMAEIGAGMAAPYPDETKLRLQNDQSTDCELGGWVAR